MDEPEVSVSPELIRDGAYPIYFGISCAFAGLQLMSTAQRLDTGLGQCPRMGDMMLQGSTQLLGLLVGKAQRKVEALEAQVRELKQRRAEDAKANEKVVGIFAGHRQNWIVERKQLMLQAQSLLNQLRAVKTRSDQAVSDWSKRVEEAEQALQLKDQALEEEAKRRTELEVKLVLAEDVAEEMNELARKEAQDHSSELWKHKTALAELVSSQRQLEADLGRALHQADAAKQELGEVLEQKEAAVSVAEKLSGEIVKLKKDGAQKENILSAVLRKSKLDVSEKQMLLKEVKITKAKKKQAELDSDKWRGMWESRNKKSSRLLKSVKTGSSEDRRSEFQLKSTEYHPKTLLLEFLEADRRKERESPNNITTVQCLDQYSSNETNDLVSGDMQHSQDWVRLETEKYVTILEQRHFTDIEAFMEQMRLKDEKLETFHWKLLSMELESKRLKSHIEGLNGSLLELRDENLKLGDMLFDREQELKSLKEQLNLYVHYWQKSNSKVTWASETRALSPEVKNTNETKDKEQIRRSNRVTKHHMKKSMVQERDYQNTNNEDTKLMQLESPHTTSTDFSLPTDHLKDYPITYIDELSSEEPITTDSLTEENEKIMTLVAQTPNEEIEEEKEVSMDPVHISKQISFDEMTEISNMPASTEKTFTSKDRTWKMDIHALGVSYKIKRLIQQLLVLEKLAGEQATKQPIIREDTPDGSNERKVHTSFQMIKGLPLVMSLLNKHVKRYQSLVEKTDDLCRRMHESYRTRSSRDANNNKEQSKLLESFLEETFQLQRYMVATGQKLLEIQSMISYSFAGSNGFDKFGFNMRQFADIVRNLLTEIQRGLEVRISRVIGDLEGTLACDGILHS